MKALITGANGFVGHYLIHELTDNGYDVISTDLHDENYPLNLLDTGGVHELVQKVAPDVIFHLAGQSVVALSWEKPSLTFEINVNGTINLLEAVRSSGKNIRVVLIGSADEYGKVKLADCPIQETLEPQPVSPYALSKYTQEKIALLYCKAYEMDVILTRSFNHTGPGQKKGFVIPDFASQIAAIEKGAEPIIRVGNLQVQRDFSDVRDVVRGYRLLAQKGKSGEVYNIGSGKAYCIKEMLELLVGLSNVPTKIEEDQDKIRPIDVPLIISDIEKIKKETGYVPRYSISETLQDTLDYWRQGEVLLGER